MAANVTTYLVETKYVTDVAKAKPGLDAVTQGAHRASGALGGLKQHFMALGAAALGGGFLIAAKKSFVDFNSDMEQLQIRMAGLLDISVGGGLERRLGTAKDLVAELQVRAEKSTSTTKELAGFLGDTIMPLTQAGLRVKDLAKFTDLAVSAAKAFGDEGTAALDIQQAFGKGVEIRDKFAIKLLRIAGVTKEAFNQFSDTKKLATFMKALEHPSIVAMKGKQEHSFLGELSTTIDKMQRNLADAGVPLFKAITVEIQGWNKWLSDNPQKIAQFASDFGSALVTGFKAVKSVVGFIVDHKEGLLSIAKAWLVFKTVKFGVGAIAGGVQGLAAMAGNASAAFGNVANAGATLATRMASAAGIIGTAGAALAAGLQWWIDHQFDRMDKDERAKLAGGAFRNDIADLEARKGLGESNKSYLAAANRVLHSARESGLLGKDGKVNEQLLYREAYHGLANPEGQGANGRANYENEMERQRALLEMAVRSEQAAMAMIEVRKSAEDLKATIDSQLLNMFGGIGGIFDPNHPPEDRANAKNNVNVHIAKVEVPAKDPDRWIQDLGNYAAKQVRAPRQARAALAGGGL